MLVKRCIFPIIDNIKQCILTDFSFKTRVISNSNGQKLLQHFHHFISDLASV